MRPRAWFVWLILGALWVLASPMSPWLPQVKSYAIGQVVSPPCGTPFWTAVPGALVQSQPLNNELNHLESCAASAAAGGGGTPVPAQTPLASAPIVVATAANSFTYSLTLGTCFNVTGNALQLNTAVCPTAGPQATPSPTTTGCGVYSGSWPYLSDTTGCVGTATANTYTNYQTIVYNAAGTDCNPIVPVEFCVLGTSTGGIAIGPNSGVWTGGSATGSSQGLYFCRSNSGTVTCPEYISLTAGGTLQLNGGSVFSTNSSAISSGKDFMGASCALSASGTMPAGSHACKLTFSGITSMTVTFSTGNAYGTQAICLAQDETTTNGAKVTACSTTSATVTASNGDVVDFVLTGM